MLKRIPLLVSLLLFLTILALVIFVSRQSPVGYWYGYITNEFGKSRVSLVVEKLVDGSFSARTIGIEENYGWTLNNVSVTRKSFHAEVESNGIIDLSLNGVGHSLNGTWKIEGKTFVLDLNRGKDFFLPRVDFLDNPVTDYTYSIPKKMSDAWETADIQTVDGDPKKIEDAVRQVLQLGNFNIHSLLVVRHGKLVLDEYFYGYGPGDEHPLASVTKSVFSTLFGIAADQGLLKPEQKLYDFFPDYRSKPGWQANKEKITLGMLLSMTSGFACEDWANQPNACMFEMVKSPDWTDFCLTYPLGHVPGQHFAYCSSCLIPLGVLLTQKCGLSVADFAQKYLYDPLGIQAHHWHLGPNKVHLVGSGHWLRPRDMAKLGLLYLNKGKWNGKQIVSQKWVEEATSIQAINDEPRTFEYGYLWWINKVALPGRDITVYYASGSGGQDIFVAPELDLVCVLTGGNFKDNEEGGQAFGIFKDYILSAFK
ncbi:MAG TPA: serine hydrolase [bacterium]